MTFKTTEELVDFLTQNDIEKIKKNTEKYPVNEYTIRKKVFKDVIFTKNLGRIEMRDCKFINCNFQDIFSMYWLMKKCKFEECTFRNSRFTHIEFGWDEIQFNHCYFYNIQVDEADLCNLYFDNCWFQTFSILDSNYEHILFTKSTLANCQFQLYEEDSDDNEADPRWPDFLFDQCKLEFSYFNGINLTNSFFINTHFYKSAFIGCRLAADTIKETVVQKEKSFAMMDLQTILRSDPLDHKILKTIFNVNSHDIKERIKDLTSEMNFNTAFISYSFKDEQFADRFNEGLKARGITTFLWKKDAPGGHKLEDIMATNIKKYNRILFIASKNSIKSQACQYELTEGRKKQEQTWEDVFFPIHIDNFLFEVKENQIKPTSKAQEYWENIEELKKINSSDFSQFNSDVIDEIKFNKALDKIVVELKYPAKK